MSGVVVEASTRSGAGQTAGAVAVDKVSAARIAPSQIPTPCRSRRLSGATPTREKSEAPAPKAADVPATQPEEVHESSSSSSRTQPGKDGYPVWLHVYDLGPVSKWVLNSWASEGAFHCGIDVIGVEFSYQGVATVTEDDDVTSGLTWHHPKSHPRHLYRESICLGTTPLKASEIAKLLENLEKVWLARDYHCLLKNCTDFAALFGQKLQVSQPFPAWVHGIAKGALRPAATQGFSFQTICSSWNGSASESVAGAIVKKGETSEDSDSLARSSARASPTMACPAPVEPPASGEGRAVWAMPNLLCGGSLCFISS